MSSIDRKVQRTAAAKQTKKTRAENNAVTKKKARATRAPKENDEPISPEAEARLSELVKRIVSLHRRSTGQVFELGECLAEAKTVQPEKRFGRWLKENFRYSVRSAWNFISVHERLSHHRERLEQHAIGSTALIALAKGEPDQIEDVIKQFDEGKSLKPQEIKALVGGKNDEAEEQIDTRQLGGKAGLQKMAAAKLKSDMEEFHRLAALVLEELEEAISRVTAGKRIILRSLATGVELRARHASDLFKDIAAPLRPVEHLPRGNLSHAKIGDQTGWGAVQDSLYRLGGVGSWPPRDEMEKWVIELAHPALRFAVHGEPYVASAKLPAAPVLEVAKVDSDVTKNDQTTVEKEEDADETPPSVSDAELDSTLNSLMAANKAPAEAHMSR
ncbi:DUF3102 domain-containing protein [Hoeflea sp. EC-HK425]|uniref:DUF3102 domain-containing protein n=1 Tax=Hoeflea sp. EC-HK425 TaxID=2038388 RepID=UPI0012565FB4|nr:DUF3102 domain-containing protein [Hoeflea sp. EC-HK425]VVT34766.1 conserved hypothetical protein [Hoeflea sp. EC-HK425]